MSAHAYGAKKIQQGRESEYGIWFARPQVADMVREQQRLRIRQRPLLTRLWSARPRVRAVDRRPVQQD